MLKFWDVVSKIAVVSLDSINLTTKQYLDVQIERLHPHITFHPGELKSVQENEAKIFHFPPTLQPPPPLPHLSAMIKAIESGIKY